ncbi:restriction endonuclease subunit S [Staphylococcus auricularis]|uniref:Restriction endonuclease subunit S n=1 Tax=Staphylococcus auricularis TaxID=29379 RepID=A0AAW7M643_9STAP|nr:restriction endonuclease subunit S [Staphylococcus auricularis]MDC6328223.1 restriction endonuclease subunit S [Staphylococcus auricularis]MDN4532225.1 restriction endonuclease subunit S [Staphylococcus auricularis]
MMKLTDREWHSFLINDLFIVESGKDIILDNNNGNLPYINSSGINNGITNYVRIGKKIQENFISIARTGTVGSTFYHDYTAVVSANIRTLRPKNFNFNKYLGMFFVGVIKFNVRDRFSYGNILGTNRIKKLKLKLPVDYNKQPDYDFMEQYIKEKYFNLKSQVKEKQKHEITDWRELSEVEWDNFKLGDIAYVNGGKDLPKYNRRPGNTPFIGSSALNNGITDFIDIKLSNTKVAKQCIGINRNGSVGYSFYHPYYAYYSGDTRFIKTVPKNKYANLFLSEIIKNQRGKYAYGYKMGTQRIKKQIIKLPISNNQPDYNFMEQYMKRKENEILDRI